MLLLRCSAPLLLFALFAPAAALKLPATTVSRRSMCHIAAAGGAAAITLAAAPYAAQASAGAIDATQVKLDVNNVGADGFKSFKGLYPTIGTKVVQRGPFNNASEMYDAMDSDVERERLKQYEKFFEFGKREYGDRPTASRML